MDIYEIFYRNPDRTIEGQIVTFESLAIDPTFNDVSSWTLIAPVEVLLRVVWKGGIVVKRNGDVFFTGRVNEMHRIKDTTVFPVINSHEVVGSSDTSYLDDFLVLPVPSGPPYTTAEFDVRSGIFEIVAKSYVDFNIGPSARFDRMITGLSIEPDYGRGQIVSGQGRFGTLLELLKSLALQSGGVGFEIVDMVFKVFAISDKSSSIVFSEDLGNLSGFQYDITRPKANYLFLGGTGSGSSRVILEGSDPESILNFERTEEFVDQSSLSDVSQMNAKIQEELAKKSKQFSLRLKVVDLPNMRPIDDYWIGDTVTAIIDGATITDVITSMVITVTPTEINVEPVIGINDLSANELTAIFSKIRDVSGRVSTLERT